MTDCLNPANLLQGIWLPQSQPVNGRKNSSHGRPGDIGANTHAVGDLSGLRIQQVNICSRLGIGAALERMFFVIQHLDTDTKLHLKAPLYRIDRSGCPRAMNWAGSP